jgi:hypothetical protein
MNRALTIMAGVPWLARLAAQPDPSPEPGRAELLAHARQELHDVRLQLLRLQRQAAALPKIIEGLEALEQLDAEAQAG